MEIQPELSLFKLLRAGGPVLWQIIIFTLASTVWLLIGRIKGCIRQRTPTAMRDIALISVGPISTVLFSIWRAANGTMAIRISELSVRNVVPIRSFIQNLERRRDHRKRERVSGEMASLRHPLRCADICAGKYSRRQSELGRQIDGYSRRLSQRADFEAGSEDHWNLGHSIRELQMKTQSPNGENVSGIVNYPTPCFQ
jgi:hypothetical protein